MGAEQRQKTRLGDLLVERGLITEEQLLLAIQEQKSSGLQLGEILVNKGWIARRHIRKTLRIQSKLRNAILTSILSVSPMLLVGCGGTQSQVGSDEVVAEQSIASSQGKQNFSEADSSIVTEQSIITSQDQPNLNDTDSPVDTQQSNTTSQHQQTSNESNSSVNAEDGSTIHLSWDYPAQRTDGSELEVYEIESFRVYQLDGNGDVGAVHVVDGLETEYDIAGLADGEYRFAVTVVDTDGLESDYSQVVAVSVL